MSRSGISQKVELENQINTLKKLGFSNDEALVYHEILSLKECTVGEISRSMNFSRAKIYGLIDNLLSEGIIVEGSKHPKSYYPVDPRDIAEKKLKEVEVATKEAQSNLYQLYQSKKVDYLETLTVKDMEILSQVVSMCERAETSIDVIASLLPSELPRNVCRAFSDASGGGDEWIKALEPIGTNAKKPHLEIAPWLIIIFSERHGTFEDGTKYKNYYVPESVGIATGFLIAALHKAGLSVLTHTPNILEK